MPKATTCNQCGRTIGATDPNFGRYAGGVLTNLCSVGCRASNLAGDPPVVKPKRPRARKVGTVTEQAISKAIESNLDLHDFWNTRLNSGKIRTVSAAGKEYFIQLCRTGTPDRFAALGLPTFFEVKRLGETPSPEQIEVAGRLRNSGSLVFCPDSIEKFLRILAAVRKRKHSIRAIADQVAQIQKEIDEEVAGNDGSGSDAK